MLTRLKIAHLKQKIYAKISVCAKIDFVMNLVLRIEINKNQKIE